MTRLVQPPSRFEDAEPSAAGYAVARVAALADDLPFVPDGPYEPRRRQLAWRATLIALLAAAAYWPSLGGGWLWQDERHVAGDAALRTLGGLVTIWAHPLAADIAPAVRTLWWLEVHTLGQGAVGFRVVSLLLHVATCGGAWLAMRRLGVPGAWLVAALFAVHPAALPNVAWVGRQGDLLGAAAAALTFVAYLRIRRIQPPADERGWTDPSFNVDTDEQPPPRWEWAAFGAAAAVSALAGSASGAIVAVGLAVIERRRRPHTPWPIWLALGGFAAASVAARWAFAGVGGTRDDTTPGLAGPVAETAAAAPWTLLHTLVPLDVPFLSDRAAWTGAAWPATLACISLALVALPLRWRRLGLVTVAIVSAYCVLHGALVARTRSDAVLAADLLPYAGGIGVIAVAVAVGLRRLHRRATESVCRVVRWLAGWTCLLALAALTYERGVDYADADRLWRHTLALTPQGLIARIELANRYVAEGFVEEAGTQLDRVADAQRGVRWLLARGGVYEVQKRHADAAACYDTARRLAPTDTQTVVRLAEAYNNADRPDLAAAQYAELLTRVKSDPGLYINAGLTQMRLGRPDAAVEWYRQALAIDARYLPAHNNLANALFDLGQYEQSSVHLQEARTIDPRNFAVFMTSGILLHRLHDPAKAERMFRVAISIDPTSPEAFDDLGIVLAAQGKLAEAVWSFTQATRLAPGHPAAGHLAEVRRQLADQAATRPAASTRPR